MFCKKYPVITLVVLITLALLIGGCNQDKSSTKNQVNNNVNTWEQIQKNKKIVVATEAAFAPFEYVEDGKIIGYDMDILSEVLKNLNLEMEQHDVPFSGIFTGLQEKKFDIIVTAISVTSERREKLGLTSPIADGSLSLIKRKGDDSIKTVEDIGGKILGAQIGSASEGDIKNFSKKIEEQGKLGVKEIKLYETVPATTLDLKNGRIDAIAQSLPIASILVKENPDDFEIVGQITKNQYVTWAVRKEDKDLLEAINNEIIKMKESGKLAELQQKWFGYTFDLPNEI